MSKFAPELMICDKSMPNIYYILSSFGFMADSVLCNEQFGTHEKIFVKKKMYEIVCTIQGEKIHIEPRTRAKIYWLIFIMFTNTVSDAS